jgi:hypothetical protein
MLARGLEGREQQFSRQFACDGSGHAAFLGGGDAGNQRYRRKHAASGVDRGENCAVVSILRPNSRTMIRKHF